MKRYVVGAGAQGRVVLETWRSQHASDTFFFLDDAAEKRGAEILGAEVIGTLAELASLDGEAILAIGANPTRLRLASIWSPRGLRFGRAIHASAMVSPSARLGVGSVVMPGAIVHTQARIGEHVVVNTAAVVEHDATIEDGASLSPGVCVGGRAFVERGAFLSTGVTVCARARIGADSVVGAGAVVTRDLPPGTFAYGIPARVVGTVDAKFDWARVL